MKLRKLQIEKLGQNNQHLDLLMNIFHHDMVWPWPKIPQSHDPMDWIFKLGKFDNIRQKKIGEMFLMTII